MGTCSNTSTKQWSVYIVYRNHLLLEVKELPPEIQAKGVYFCWHSLPFTPSLSSSSSFPSPHRHRHHTFLFKGGPLSISTDVAQAFKLNGLKNVYIRRVNKKEVGLDMVEVRFKACA